MILGLDVGPAGGSAVVVDAEGRVVSTGRHDVVAEQPRPGWVECSPEGLWQAALGAVRAALATYDGPPVSAVGLTGPRGVVVLWDRETLGSPRPAVRAASPAGALAWIAEHEPHTWALVESGRYAIGTVDSYLVARTTRGTWHLTDVSQGAGTGLLDLTTGTWSAEACSRAGVPLDALPELVPTWGRLATTEPRTFLGLEVAVGAVVADRSAALVASACFDRGEACTRDGSAIVNAGPGPVSVDGLSTVAAWGSPSGELVLALEGPDALAAAVATSSRPEPDGAAVLGAAYLAGLGAGAWTSYDDLRGLA